MLSAKQELLRQPILDVIDVIALNGIFLDIDFFRAVFSDKAAERCHPHQHFPTSNLKHDFHVRGF